MKIISWNINGIRTGIKGVQSCLRKYQPDILCLQETKVIDKEVEVLLQEWRQHYSYQERQDAQRKGYSGTLCLSNEPYAYQAGFGISALDKEGRLQVMEYADFSLINIYLPSIHDRSSLERQDYRMKFDDELIELVDSLQARGEVILCGDLNAAGQKEDMSNTHQRYGGLESGFMREDDQTLMGLQELGLVDTFRYKHPNRDDAYTWWSNKNGKRETNQGCRLDYILVSRGLVSGIKGAEIYTDVKGSDHCPISVEIDL